jgi:hypothetical protein
MAAVGPSNYPGYFKDLEAFKAEGACFIVRVFKAIWNRAAYSFSEYDEHKFEHLGIVAMSVHTTASPIISAGGAPPQFNGNVFTESATAVIKRGEVVRSFSIQISLNKPSSTFVFYTVGDLFADLKRALEKREDCKGKDFRIFSGEEDLTDIEEDLSKVGSRLYNLTVVLRKRTLEEGETAPTTEGAAIWLKKGHGVTKSAGKTKDDEQIWETQILGEPTNVTVHFTKQDTIEDLQKSIQELERCKDKTVQITVSGESIDFSTTTVSSILGKRAIRYTVS